MSKQYLVSSPQILLPAGRNPFLQNCLFPSPLPKP